MSGDLNRQFNESYTNYGIWRESALRSVWGDNQRKFGTRQYLFADGSAPLFRDVSEPFDFTRTRKESVTGQNFIPKYDLDFQKKVLDIQLAEFARRANEHDYVRLQTAYKADTSELKKNIAESKKNIKPLELAAERQRQIQLLRESVPEIDRLASEIESEAFKEFALAKEQHTIIDRANLEGRGLTAEEAKRSLEIAAQDKDITKRQGRIVSLLTDWDWKLKDYGLDPKKWGGTKMAHLLAATPYDEIKSLVNAARTGGVVDAEGNFPSPEEIRERYVKETYQPTVDALAQGARPYTDEEWAGVESRAKAQRDAEAAKAKEAAVQRRLDLNNNSLLFKGINL